MRRSLGIFLKTPFMAVKISGRPALLRSTNLSRISINILTHNKFSKRTSVISTKTTLTR